MPSLIKIGGTNRDILGRKVMIGGVWRSIVRGAIKIDGDWRELVGPISDDFNRPNEAPIQAPWYASYNFSPPYLTDNKVSAGPGNYIAYYSGTPVLYDQQWSIRYMTGTGNIGVCGRLAGVGVDNRYMAWCDASTFYIQRVPTGQNLDSYSYSRSPGDVFTIRCVGSSITGYINGVLRCSATDSTIASGYGGVYLNDTDGDDFYGGSL